VAARGHDNVTGSPAATLTFPTQPGAFHDSRRGRAATEWGAL